MSEKIYTRTFMIMWPFIVVVSGLLYFVVDGDTAYSFALGSVASMLAMSYHYKAITKTMKERPDKVRFISVLNYAIRYVFYIVILGISFLREDFDLIYVFLGLISFKFVMFFNILFSRKVGDE